MVAFIDQHRQVYAVESIFAQSAFAPSTYYQSLVYREKPEKRFARAYRGDKLSDEFLSVWEAN